MPITQMLKEARDAGEATVVVHDGVFCLRWVGARQIWLFVPRG